MNTQAKEVIILVGIHGCGKSSYARERWGQKPGCYILAWEDVKKDYPDEGDRIVYKNFMHRLKQALLDKRPKFGIIIIDSTNLTYRQRCNYYSLIKKHCPNARTYIDYFKPDVARAIFWNSRKPRANRATPSTILNDANKIQYPFEFDGIVVNLESPPPQLLLERNIKRKWETAEQLLEYLIREVSHGNA